MEKLQNKLDYSFKNTKLLELALTHSSIAKQTQSSNNERIEFLGDAVLELCVSDFLFHEYIEFNEGELTRLRSKIVCEESLANIARQIDLGKYIMLGHGEDISGGREKNSILADALEAVFGAIFIDGGFNCVQKVIMSLIGTQKFTKQDIMDPKTYLQELIQAKSKQPLEYKIVSETGPPHDKFYVSQVIHCGKVLGEGSGKSKKESEQNAAAQALTQHADDFLK